MELHSCIYHIREGTNFILKCWIRHSCVGNFSPYQDLLTSNSSTSSNGLSTLKKGIETGTGMRHWCSGSGLARSAPPARGGLFPSSFRKSPLSYYQRRCSFRPHIQEDQMRTEARSSFCKNSLLATICENALTSVCVYGPQLFAHHTPQLFIDGMIGILEYSIFLLTRKCYLWTLTLLCILGLKRQLWAELVGQFFPCGTTVPSRQFSNVGRSLCVLVPPT